MKSKAMWRPTIRKLSTRHYWDLKNAESPRSDLQTVQYCTKTNKEYFSIGLKILTPSSIITTRLTPLSCSASQSSHLPTQVLRSPRSTTRSLKDNTSAGIPAEALKNGGYLLTKNLHQLQTTKNCPSRLPFIRERVTICGNSRGISLLSVAGNVLTRTGPFNQEHHRKDLSRVSVRLQEGSVHL